MGTLRVLCGAVEMGQAIDGIDETSATTNSFSTAPVDVHGTR